MSDDGLPAQAAYVWMYEGMTCGKALAEKAPTTLRAANIQKL
jgi:hypothetical protein